MEVSVIGNTILSSIKGNILSSITELEQLKTTNTDVATLISDYKVVVNKLDDTISRLSTFNASTFPEEIKSLNTEIDTLNGRKLDILKQYNAKKEISTKSIISDIYTEIKTHLIFITTVIGMTLGCIVASHWLITADLPIERNSFYFLFYAIFGALLFPIPVLYGVVNPPMWRAPLIPLFIRNESSPAWVNIPGISLFSYIPPTPNDLYVGKEVLRIMCIIVSGFIGVSMYFKITG